MFYGGGAVGISHRAKPEFADDALKKALVPRVRRKRCREDVVGDHGQRVVSVPLPVSLGGSLNVVVGWLAPPGQPFGY